MLLYKLGKAINRHVCYCMNTVNLLEDIHGIEGILKVILLLDLYML